MLQNRIDLVIELINLQAKISKCVQSDTDVARYFDIKNILFLDMFMNLEEQKNDPRPA